MKSETVVDYFFSVFDPYEHMDLCSQWCSSSQRAVVHGKNFNVGCYAHQTF